MARWLLLTADFSLFAAYCLKCRVVKEHLDVHRCARTARACIVTVGIPSVQRAAASKLEVCMLYVCMCVCVFIHWANALGIEPNQIQRIYPT